MWDRCMSGMHEKKTQVGRDKMQEGCEMNTEIFCMQGLGYSCMNFFVCSLTGSNVSFRKRLRLVELVSFYFLNFEYVSLQVPS